MGAVMALAKLATNSLMTLRRRVSSSTFASNMFSTTLGMREPAEPRERMSRSQASGEKRDSPRSRSSWKVDVRVGGKEMVMSRVVYSMSKATIWDFRIRRCLIRKRRPSAGVR